jgi:hypothetical protein
MAVPVMHAKSRNDVSVFFNCVTADSIFSHIFVL